MKLPVMLFNIHMNVRTSEIKLCVSNSRINSTQTENQYNCTAELKVNSAVNELKQVCKHKNYKQSINNLRTQHNN